MTSSISTPTPPPPPPPPDLGIAHSRVTPSIKFAGAQFHTPGWIEALLRGQDHNTVLWPGLLPELLDPESSSPITRATMTQGRSDHIRTYAHAYLENLKNIYLSIHLFIYLFIYNFIGEKRLLHMQEFFSHCFAAFCIKKTLRILHYSFILIRESKTQSSQRQ